MKLMNGRVGPREEMVVPVDVTWTAEVGVAVIAL